ncbi:MAG: hypothetical protein IJT28_08085 [Bacteroidaceae bacterium]|nr:hypothetical protein [Bacteroidaceae bacterium]
MAVTWHLTLRFGDEIYKEGDCLSTDTKPVTDTTLMNGSKLTEIDTADVYRYDKENTQWRQCGSESGGGSGGGVEFHICTSGEYNTTTGVPTVSNPDPKTFYLVPDGSGNDLFVEWIYVNNAWEKFASARVDLSGYVTGVTVNGTSVVTSGVAAIQKASSSTFGVVKPDSKTNAMTQAVGVDSNGKLYTTPGGVTGVTVNGTSVVTNGVAAIPKASSSAFGVVNPDAKTNEMTQAVGVDSNGKLYTAPGSGGGSSDIYFVNFTYNYETKQFTTTDTIANIWSQVATSGKQAIAKFTDDTWGWDDRIGHERIPLFTIWNTNNGWYNYFVEFVNTRWRIVGKHNWQTDVDSWKIEFFSQPIASESIAYYIEEETGVGEDIHQGDVFVWRGKLYVATQTIWSGDTITVGTNCEETTIANTFIRKPEIPQEEGTYHLQVSVDDGGEATISWVADT